MVNPYRGGKGKLPPPGLQADEKKKLWIFAILFVIVLALFLGSVIYQNVGEEPQKEAPTPDFPIDVAPEHRGPGGEAQSTWEPQSMPELRDEAEEMLRNRLTTFRESGELGDEAEADSTAVLDYLVDKAYGDVKVNRISTLYYRKLPEKDVLFEPAEYRGRLTSAFGKIVAVPDPIPYEGTVKEVKELFPVVFRTSDDVWYRALSTTKIEKQAGDWIQVFGIFYRVQRIEADGEPRQALSILMTKKPENAYPPVTITEIDPEWAKLIHENDLESARKNEPPFWYLLNYAENLGIEGYRKAKESAEIRVEDMGDQARPLVRSPELYRFQFISAEGRIIEPYRDYLDEDNPGKIRMVTTAILIQPSGYFVRLAAPRPWSDYGFKIGEDFVRVEGIFYKRWQYIPKAGGSAREIPLVIVTDVVPLTKSESGFMVIVQWTCVGLAGLILLAFFAFAVRDRKARAAFRERLERQKRERESKRSGGGLEGPPEE